MLEGGTSQTKRNRAEGEEGKTMPRVFDEAHFASDSSSFRCTRWTTSNAYRIYRESIRNRERERGGRMTGGKRRRRGGKKEKKGKRRRGRSTLEALRALLCPRGRVCGSEISREPSFTSSPLFHPLRPVFRAFANLHLPSGYTSLPSGRPSQLHGSPSFPREPRVHEMQPIFPSALA